MSPTKASEIVIQRISRFYPKFFGAVISVTKDGEFGMPIGLGLNMYLVSI